MLKNTLFNFNKLKTVYGSSFAYSNIVVNYNNTNRLSWWNNLKMNLGITKLRYKPTQINVSAQKLYAIASEYPDFNEYINHFKLPNTYQTWFTMMGLHSWLILLRLKSEGIEGEVAKIMFFRTLYEDISKRTKNFQVGNKAKVQKYLQSQLAGLMVSLDEGLLSDDCVLANAIWQNVLYMFNDESSDDLHRLETMVAYVWKQIHHLKSLNSDAIFVTSTVSFLPIESDLLNKHYAKMRIDYCLSRSDDVHYV